MKDIIPFTPKRIVISLIVSTLLGIYYNVFDGSLVKAMLLTLGLAVSICGFIDFLIINRERRYTFILPALLIISIASPMIDIDPESPVRWIVPVIFILGATGAVGKFLRGKKGESRQDGSE